MTHIREPLTMPKHPKLLEEINETSIAIKLWHTIIPDTLEEQENIEKAKQVSGRSKPTWEQMTDLLNKCYKAINEQRENPVKY